MISWAQNLEKVTNYFVGITASLPPMQIENLEQLIHIISKGDTSSAEVLFNKPGGRKHLEIIVLIVISNLPYLQDEKEELFNVFRKTLNKIEKRIKHQKEGQKILEQVYG